MNKIKNLITAALLGICLVSFGVSATESFIPNETPFLPAITEDKKDDILDKESTDNIETSNKQGEFESSPDFVGGGSASPSIKPTEKDEQAQTDAKQGEVQAENNIRTFVDITKDDWFYNDVMFVFNHKIMTGTGDSEFSPDTTLNRAMMITILHRIDGDNSTYEKNFFNDIEKNSWYEKAVNWGYKNKIVAGTSESAFAPMDDLTREQLCVMIYNYTKHMGFETEFANISSFSDNNKVSDWAKDAVSWAVKEKIVTGKEENILAPNDSATRAEAAAIIRRYIKKFVEPEEE